LIGDLYRFYTTESKYDKEIAPSPTTFEREAFQSKTTFLVKYISDKADLVWQIAAYIFVQYFRQQGIQN
jgi:hypothetical protein